MCVPLAGVKRRQMFNLSHAFGPNGSIATQEACIAAGGEFKPVIFGWMTHVDLYDSYEKQ
jgi:hypothetical protein